MIRQLPPSPSRDRPNEFSAEMDAFLAELPGFVDDANALEQSLQVVATTGTSTTALTVGVGSKSLATQPGKAWATGAWVYIFAAAAVSNYMVGRVTSYNVETGALVVNVSAIDGSGSHSSWIIGLATPVADGHLVARDGSRAMTGELLLAADAVNALGAVTKQQMDAAVASVIAPGALQAFAMSSAPSGWLKANGAAISRSTYATLFAAIGTTFGAGDGSTTFNLPDLRGEFVRGWDDGRGVDSGRGFGTAQADEFEAHYHDVRTNSATGSGTGGGGYFISDAGVGALERTRATPSGGSETRPRNVALLYCIKF